MKEDLVALYYITSQSIIHYKNRKQNIQLSLHHLDLGGQGKGKKHDFLHKVHFKYFGIFYATYVRVISVYIYILV